MLTSFYIFNAKTQNCTTYLCVVYVLSANGSLLGSNVIMFAVWCKKIPVDHSLYSHFPLIFLPM